jgi:hypothetical protein
MLRGGFLVFLTKRKIYAKMFRKNEIKKRRKYETFETPFGSADGFGLGVAHAGGL